MRSAEAGWLLRPAGTDAGRPVTTGIDDPRRHPADVAYVVFTSGTTGRPKGVVGSHRGLAHFIAWQRDTFGVGPGDRVAQLTAPGFDVVLRDLLLPLTSGAALVLPDDPHLRPDPARVPRWLEERRVTVVHAVPTLARAWLAAGADDVALPNLRWVFFAGEPLPAALVEAWRRSFPESPASRSDASPSGDEAPASGEAAPDSPGATGRHGIVNLYGPTETTLARCWFVVPEPPVPGVQPVGRALPGSQALVLAAGGGTGETSYRRCAPGEVGEIVLRTPYRSHGYLDGRPAFFPNPLRAGAAADDDLLYATGDLGRVGLDGRIEILGRRDAQVKIRGVRLEPAEVEAALAAHPAVAAAAVVVDDAAGGGRLAAWVVPAEPPTDPAADAPTGPPVASPTAQPAEGTPALDSRGLRRHLARRLPPALVPARFLALDRLPTTATGKVDRSALPPLPDPGTTGGSRPPAPPRDATEAALLEVFREVLGVPDAGVRDDFFALGGHSLLAVPLLTRVEERLGRRLPLAALFRHSTVEDLARLLRAAGAATAGEGLPSSSLVTLQEAAGSPRPPLFLVHPGGGGVLCYSDLATALGGDQPVHALQSAGLDGGEAPLTSVDAMAERYLADLQQVWPAGPIHLAGWSFGGRVAFEMARRLREAGREVAFLALLDITPDPSPGPADARDEDDAALLARALAETFPVRAEELRALEREGGLRGQVEHLLEAGRAAAEAAGRPWPDVDPRRAEALLRVFKSNIAAARAFDPRPYPGRVLLVRGVDSDRFAGDDSDPRGDATGGWGALAGEVRVVTVPGDHHSMVRPPHVAHLAATLRAALEASSPASVPAPAAGRRG